MQLALIAVAALGCSAAIPLLLWRRDRAALVAGGLAGSAACAVGLFGSVRAAIAGSTGSWQGPWSLPIGSFRLGIDPLSAFFLACLFAVGLAASIYGIGSMRVFAATRRVAWTAAALNALLAAVALVLLARDGVLFLLAWEAMTLSAFLLVAFEHEKRDVREGALWYLVCNHFGVAALFAYFALLGNALGTSALPAMAMSLPPAVAGALLALALIGFGTKMGLVPFHAWLPAAHPVAPSHVSALLSSVLLNCGAYGLLRTLLLVRGVPALWGWALLALGGASALAGAINMLAATDLKRALAYSSIENVGIVALSIGTAVVGLASRSATIAAFGLGGALFHLLTHSLFKSLLFAAAGCAVHGAHTRNLEELGGLLRRMPRTGALFLCGAAAAAAVPGLSGFASELLVYRGLFDAVQHLRPAGQAACAAAIAALALTGGLAAAGLARIFGIAFSGTPRSEPAAHAQEQPASMLLPVAALAVASLALGVYPRAALALLSPALAVFGVDAATLAPVAAQLARVGQLGFTFLAAAALIALLRRVLLRARAVTRAVTWACGYEAPTPRMQSSAASFASPALQLFGGVVELHRSGAAPQERFAGAIVAGTFAVDRVEATLYRRAPAWAARKLAALRALHRPQLQSYLLYVFVALVALLWWRLG